MTGRRKPGKILATVFVLLAALVTGPPPWVGVLPALGDALAQPSVLYVSPLGNDTWSGKFAAPTGKGDGPFATVAKARDAIRTLKASGQWHAPIRIVVRGGEYFLDQPLVFAPVDSGSQQWPITYAGYPGDSYPVLSGGRRITGWKKLSAPLPGLAIAANGNLWVADIPKGWDPRELALTAARCPGRQCPRRRIGNNGTGRLPVRAGY